MDERFGEYVVVRLLGEGGMGKVYEAEERLSKRRVALKVLRPELLRHDDARRLFLNEMRILAHLEHPGIVRSLASFEHEGQLVMALELIEGKTLRAVLNEGRKLPWGEAIAIAIQIAEALSVAHAQATPIVHRDLKPENVMIGGDGAVKVMDFGIAKVLETAQATNTQSIGTLQYMSPEQIDARTVDARSDLYALGLVLYEMLSGAAPFRSASPRELLNLQCTATPPDLDDELRDAMPAGVERTLMQLLEKAPEARPASARAAAEALAAFMPRSRGDRKTRETTGVASDRGASTKAAAAPEALPAHAPEPPKRALDTVALIERASAPRQVPTRLAFAVIAALSLISGIGVYAARVHGAAPRGASSDGTRTVATASATTAPASTR